MLGNEQAYVLKKMEYKYLELFGVNPKIVFLLIVCHEEFITFFFLIISFL